MPETSTLIGFAAASLVVLLVPGPGVLYVVTRTLGQGLRAGFISVLGLSIGALAHVLAAAIGLSVVLLASATAFGIVKGLGAAYLIYLGIRTLLSRDDDSQVRARPSRSLSRVFLDGVLVSVLNPKIAVFFLAFLPQFADATRGAIPRQVLLLGFLYAALALVTDGTYAVLAGCLRSRLRGRVLRGRAPRYAAGTVYIGLGLTTAFADRP